MLAGVLLIANAVSRPLEDHGPDGGTYEALGYNAATHGGVFSCGHFSHSYWSPGWVVTIASLYKIAGRNPILIRIFLIVLAMVTGAMIYIIAREVVGRWAAVAAVVLFLFSKLVFRFTAYYQYEVVLTLLVTLIGLLFLGHRAGSNPSDRRFSIRILVAGLLMGIAALVSSRVLILVPLLLVCTGIQGGMRRATTAAVLFSVGLLVVLVPWTIRNYRCFGEVIITTSNAGINLYIGNNASSTGGYFLAPKEQRPNHALHDSRPWVREALDYMSTHRLQTLGRSVEKGLRYWNPHYGDQILLLLLFVIGWVRYLRARPRTVNAEVLWILAVPFVLMALHMVFFVQVRFFLPAMPFVAIVAGAGLFGWRANAAERAVGAV